MTLRIYLLPIIVLIVATLNLSFVSVCPAAIYAYTDTNGVVHFTNVPADPKYRLLFGSRTSPFSSSRREFVYDPHIQDAAHFFDLDPSLIKAVIKKESDFNRYAVSSKGAVGLMQLMPDTARAMNVSDLYDPRENIFGGSRYLKKLSKLFNGDLDLVLASYNAGPDRVLTTKSIPDIRETKKFVKTVRRYYRHYKKNTSMLSLKMVK